MVKINTERRGKLTISHSGIHLVLMGLEEIYPGIYKSIKGCCIKETGARLDFAVDYRFSVDDISRVQDYVGNMIAMAKKMFVFPHKEEKEAWYWLGETPEEMEETREFEKYVLERKGYLTY